MTSPILVGGTGVKGERSESRSDANGALDDRDEDQTIPTRVRPRPRYDYGTHVTRPVPLRPAREGLTMNAPSETRLLLRVDEAGRRLNLGRTVMYELIRSGRLRSVKVGKRRLIPTSALVEFVDQLGGAA